MLVLVAQTLLYSMTTNALGNAQLVTVFSQKLINASLQVYAVPSAINTMPRVQDAI